MNINRRRFIKKVAAAGATCFAAGSFGMGLGSDAKVKSDKRPNVLWLISEDMGHQLSCYGFDQIQTPNIDRLAKEGARFDNAFGAGPACSPCRSSFNTGMYPTVIGSCNHRTYKENKKKLPEGVKTITQWFADAGYHTCLMGNPKEDFNFIPEGKTYDSKDWSNRTDGQPFMSMYNFIEPHRWGWSKWDELAFHIDPNKVDPGPIYPDHPVMKQSFAKYLDFIVELDRKIGLVYKRLEDEGLLDNTIIFFLGDNGQTIYRGKQWLYDQGMRVPFIARYPKVFKPGTVRDDVVSQIDLLPTALDLAGIDVPAKIQGQIIAGPNRNKRKYAFAQRCRSDNIVDCIRSVHDGRFHYIRNYMPEVGYPASDYVLKAHPEYSVAKELYEQGKLTGAQSLFFAERKPDEELYDVEKDQWETNNLAKNKAYQNQLNRLRKALDDWQVEIDDPALKSKS